MSADAIARVTVALQNRLASAIAGPVYVGPPIPDDVGARKAALFLFHVVPNQALRNEPHYVARPSDPAGPLIEAPALPLDLRFLVSVFRTAGSGGGGVSDPDELRTLGLIVQTLHERPFIDGTRCLTSSSGSRPSRTRWKSSAECGRCFRRRRTGRRWSTS
ncbi:hypothetical protein BJF90_34865 [Pseudonocardia sp. CNS-004]|nr:hypothetical protein BJF90_34865 [Pseudonocardia sp. CNS-004]